MQFIFHLSEFLYSGGAGLTQASTSTKNLIFWKKYCSPKIGNRAQKQPKKAQNSNIKRLGNFDGGGASLKDLQRKGYVSVHQKLSNRHGLMNFHRGENG